MKNIFQRLIFPLLLSAFVLSLTACNKDELLQKFASPEEQVFAKQYIRHLQLREFEAIERAVDPSIQDQNLRNILQQMADLLPTGEPTVVTLIGAHRQISDGYTSLNLTYEYGYADKWILANVNIKKSADTMSIIGFSVTPQPNSIEVINQFSLSGKSALHYLILTLAIIFPLITLLALVICVRMKMRGRKWPWVLFILAGFGTLAINWTSGVVQFIPVSVRLFSASAVAPIYGPWTVAISLPIGAICFLIFRKNHAATLETTVASNDIVKSDETTATAATTPAATATADTTQSN
ncbi:hypothetical protein [Undibacterium flavidum]|uniref:Uncharacterized protein n=1 Tax=Undibacterium flavidum TaxID=2762297 RepID=A0ABR6YB54_9BURK|nr:hypothetical protein [Undibacterium flavidum]MBC3873794.1 hypothetical protein [Undibacterium flavidum]